MKIKEETRKLFTKLMTDLKSHNDLTTWKNLSLGIITVFLVVILSVSYFNKLSKSLEIKPLTDENIVENIKEERNNKPATASKIEDETVIVEEGEGLWHVALRVCGNGEAYSALATANSLTIDSEVYVGQKLIKKCN